MPYKDPKSSRALESQRKRSEKYKNLHPERLLESYKKYHSKPENKQKQREYDRVRRSTQEYREHNRITHRYYMLTHPEKTLHRFKEKWRYLSKDPKIGVCNWCRAVTPFDCNRTSLHHDENRYNINNPLQYTIEICDSCHMKESRRLQRFKTFRHH